MFAEVGSALLYQRKATQPRQKNIRDKLRSQSPLFE